MKTLEEVKQWLSQHKSLLQERYKVRELGIFGSYVRQEQTETSDIDVLVEFSETPSLLKFINLENYLSDNLGIKVDLVHKSGLKPRIGERILAEVVYLRSNGKLRTTCRIFWMRLLRSSNLQQILNMKRFRRI
uniref:nucleotidyltransferase family protein n=1 Tax=Chroococcidiopsis sp. TS-821 TaxID=1378066 RepID=UPI001FEE2642|nr:nucleotidyltransferase family protein [Chroococcidiopsis sp. TS-821]